MFRFGLERCVLAIALMIAAPELSCGQERLITVTGTGSVELIPDVVVASFNISGSAETVAGALDDFQRNRQRIEDTLNPMDFPGVTLEFKGKSVGDSQSNQMQMMMFGDGMQEANQGASTISENFLVRFKVGEDGVNNARLAELTRMIDTAIAAKAKPGALVSDFYNPVSMASGIVSVTVSDRGAAEQKATRAAFEDAREKAAFLASLGGMELGEVHSIEMDSPSTGAALDLIGNMPVPVNSPLVGSRIQVKSTLTVKFSVRSRPPE